MNMDWNVVMHYVSKAGMVLTALFAAVLSYKAAVDALGKGKRRGKELIHEFDVKQLKSGAMGEKQSFCSRYGIMYRMRNYHLLPSQYMILRASVGMMAALLALYATRSAASLLAFFAGYFAVELFFKLMNRRDNEDMTMDIYNTYANMKIQLSSGVYIGDCLEYTYKIVKNARYKEALKELLLNFSDKTMTSAGAIAVFKGRFACGEIGKLCSMMTSFVEYGISDSYMQDIMYEVESLLEADAMKSQHAIEQRTGAIIFAFFVLVVGMVVIGMMGSFDGAEMFFAG